MCAEYDALPGLGHACGHDVIAASAVGAAAGPAPVADELGLRVTVFGTPAEEGGGGRIHPLERGVFDGVHLAMMRHPGPVDVAEADPFAVAHCAVDHRGRAAHAAAYPEQGRNAADAFTVAQVAIGLLRRQLPSGVRGTGARRDDVRRRGAQRHPRAHPGPPVRADRDPRRAGGAATAGGALFRGGRARHRVRPHHRAGEPALRRVPQRARSAGGLPAQRRCAGPHVRGTRGPGGADEPGLHGHGQRLADRAAIHPCPGIGSLPAVDHQKEFAAHAAGPAGDRAVLDGATAPALTAADAAADTAQWERLLAGRDTPARG
ncbi:zinc-binding metallopeptidase family protein [Streptomyces cacaoi]|uniref:amidohydrolase n=1 Tax=Streptomyces cacaoi TaxID=1898 RepID=UPI003749BADD